MKNKIKYFLFNLVLLGVIALAASSAQALGGLAGESTDISTAAVGEYDDLIYGLQGDDLITTSGWPVRSSFSHDFAQSQNERLKSRGEVMSEVKRRYDAKILKITLDRAREVYVVRLLMPNGKVKTVRVSARA